MEPHHKDGDRANNSEENLEFLCPPCHDAELWKTLKQQRERHIEEIGDIIQKGIEGEMNGSVIEKLLDALKMTLGLERSICGFSLLEPPAVARRRELEFIAQEKLSEYLRGFKEALSLGVEIASGKRKDKS
jgi:hypothetical protein